MTVKDNFHKSYFFKRINNGFYSDMLLTFLMALQPYGGVNPVLPFNSRACSSNHNP